MRPGREPAAFLGRGNSPVRQHFPQILPRIRFRAGGDLLGRTGADDLSAAVTALICMRLTVGQLVPLLLLILLSAFIAALSGLFIAGFSESLMMGIMYIKLVMILFLAPPILFYLLLPAGGALRALTYLLPSSATFYGLMKLLNGSGSLGKRYG